LDAEEDGSKAFFFYVKLRSAGRIGRISERCAVATPVPASVTQGCYIELLQPNSINKR